MRTSSGDLLWSFVFAGLHHKVAEREWLSLQAALAMQGHAQVLLRMHQTCWARFAGLAPAQQALCHAQQAWHALDVLMWPWGSDVHAAPGVGDVGEGGNAPQHPHRHHGRAPGPRGRAQQRAPAAPRQALGARCPACRLLRLPHHPSRRLGRYVACSSALPHCPFSCISSSSHACLLPRTHAVLRLHLLHPNTAK